MSTGVSRQQFERWIDLYGSELYHTCLRRVRGRADLAEELLHEVYLTAWHKRAGFEGDDEGARRWLHRIAFNLTPAVWRRNRDTAELSPDLLERVLATQAPEADDVVDPRELARLHHCFGQVDPIDQNILQMRFGLRADPEAPEVVAALGWADIARMLASALGAVFQPDQVRVRAARCLVRLRQCMGAQPAGSSPGVLHKGRLEDG